MKKEIIKKAILVVIGVFLVILTFAYLKFKPIYKEYDENLDNRMVRVYYAVQDLDEGDIIYANMVTTKEIYVKYLDNDYVSYTDADLLVGKCVKENASIRAQDIIKSSLVEECK